MTRQAAVAVVGECMLELSQSSGTALAPTAGGSLSLSYGGDTLNTAVYLSRLGVAVDYVTALGDDNMSDWMIGQWQAEGVGCDLVARTPNSVPGMYIIQTDASGERSFLYWRDSAPARQLFDDQAAAAALFANMASTPWLYLSGITLALYRGAALARFVGLLADYCAAGGKVIFDGNYRPRLWATPAAAQAAFQSVYALSAIALPTLEDELMLFGDRDADAVVARLQGWGVAEIGLKMGAEGCLVVTKPGAELVASRRVEVVDTTAAGDSFNAGYLAARINGASAAESAEGGHNLASVVIQHRGAIIAREAMPAQ
jgi:2-dehydro-3-deoxygluconokinase